MLGNLAFSIHTLAASLPASITFMADTALEVETVTPDLDAWDLETALDHVGIGLFQWTALAVCGLANAADAVEILGLSLVLPAAEEELHLTPAGKSALSSCIFMGMLLGGLIWGPMGDALGRRMTLVVSLAINGAFGMLSAAARNTADLVFLRLVAGIGVGGSVPVVFSFLAELLPAHARGKFMVGLAAFWMVGSLYSAGAGWAMIPSVGWRAFLLVAALPAFAAAAGCLLLLPESPRHLLVHGKVGPAEVAIRRMAAVNRVKMPTNMKLRQRESHMLASSAADAVAAASAFPMQTSNGGSAACAQNGIELSATHAAAGASINTDGCTKTGTHQAGGPGAAVLRSALPVRGTQQRLAQQAKLALQTTGQTAKQLLQAPLRSRFLPLLVAWIGMCGGWYSTVLWIPEYFKARGSGTSSIYAESFAVAAANLPGNIASVYMVDRLGRRLTACVCLAGSCVAALAFAAAPADPVWSVVAACVFNAISVGGWNALDLLSAELFPTEVRSTAMGMLGATGRLASFATTYLAGALMQLQLWAPLIVAAGLLAAGSVAMMLLPEMALKPLEDTVEDAAQRTQQAGDSLDAGLRSLSLQGVAASITDSITKHRRSSASSAAASKSAGGLEEFRAESPRSLRAQIAHRRSTVAGTADVGRTAAEEGQSLLLHQQEVTPDARHESAHRPYNSYSG